METITNITPQNTVTDEGAKSGVVAGSADFKPKNHENEFCDPLKSSKRANIVGNVHLFLKIRLRRKKNDNNDTFTTLHDTEVRRP